MPPLENEDPKISKYRFVLCNEEGNRIGSFTTYDGAHKTGIQYAVKNRLPYYIYTLSQIVAPRESPVVVTEVPIAR